MFVVNKTGADLALPALVESAAFPTFQDNWDWGVWSMHGGGKDDFLVYNGAGNLVVHLKADGVPSSDLSTPAGFAAVKEAIENAF